MMNNPIRITVAAPLGIDAAALNDELKAALLTCDGFHDAVTAIVVCDAADEAAVRAVIAAHIANTATRGANKTVLEQIIALEATVTQRVMRERGQRLTDVDNQITVLRAQLQ